MHVAGTVDEEIHARDYRAVGVDELPSPLGAAFAVHPLHFPQLTLLKGDVMRLGRRSSNIEDRRGMGVPLVAGGGLGGVVLLLLYFLLGGDPSEMPAPQQPGGGQASAADPNDPGFDFVSRVLADTEDTWKVELPRQARVDYREPTLVVFTDAVQSACGFAQAAVGPFYCPLDEKVYIDLGFYRDLRERFQAPGDFAQAYVIGHEVGHHLQKILGIAEQVHAQRSRLDQEAANALSVRQELQADCFAGVWAHHSQRTRNTLEPGDIEEGLNAASAIGDDNIQRQTRGYVAPESFTHGSSAQRVEWFKRGYESGQIGSCDTFAR